MKLKIIGIYSGIIGALYIAYGIIEAYSWVFGALNFPLYPSPDIMGAFILTLIGSVLLYRLPSLMNMKYEGLSFLFVGLVLSAIIGIMYILIMGADILDCAVNGEQWTFDPYAYNIPAIALFILLLPAWSIIRSREDFGE